MHHDHAHAHDGMNSHAAHGHAGHGHAHGAMGHSHAPASFGRAFAVGVALNTALVAAEAGFGVASHSMALLSDALHNLGDVLGLLFAWGATWLVKLAPTASRTYGWGRSTILAALANAVVLLVGSGAIAVEAVQRFWYPEHVAGGTVVAVALAAIFVNGATAVLFIQRQGDRHDINIRAAFLHMAADAGVALGVAVAAMLIQLTGLLWLDPAASLLIAAITVAGTWGLMREAMALAMDAVPAGVDAVAVQQSLTTLPAVVEVHDLHIWGLSTTQTAVTAHLVISGDGEGLVPTACAVLRERFGIGHATLQVETVAIAADCALRPAGVV